MVEGKLTRRVEHPQAAAQAGEGVHVPGIARHLPVIGALGVLVLAVAVIRETAGQISVAAVAASLHVMSPAAMVASLGFTIASYLLLVSYDFIALRAAGVRVSPALAAAAGFIASAMSQTLGFGLATAGGVRMRLYGSRGITAPAILRITLVAGLSFWLGLGTVAALALLAEPASLAALTGLSEGVSRALGAVLALVLLGYVAGRLVFPGPLRIARFELHLPGLRSSLLQMAIGSADIAASAAALWMVFPDAAAQQLGFPGFAGLYALLTVVGYASHVPGGLGVLEAGLIFAFPLVPVPELLASVLAFRVIYYALPFLLSLALFAAAEMRLHAVRLQAAYRLLRPIAVTLLPPAIATAVFLGGVLLLVSGSTPALESRIEILQDIVPLPFIEISHLINSVAGFFLLILSIGLYRRLDAAWVLTALVLCCGIAVSLVKGLDWEEALTLAMVLALGSWGRRAFYRRSSLFNEEPTPAAFMAVGLACLASIAVGFLAFRNVDYSGELWWQVAYSGDAPRFLRASLLTVLAAGGTGIYLLLRPARGCSRTGYRIPPQVPAIVHRAERTEPCLALTGDKRFLPAEEGDAFLMYDVQGTSWVTMGDPVGNPARFPALLWSFREMVDRAGGRAVFYQVRAEFLPHYLDLGLTLLKLGEEAVIDLAAFSLEGGARANLRQSARRAEKQGLAFAVVPAAEVSAIMAELGDVSDDWLTAKHMEEKRFSVGHFDPAYLCQFDHAVVRHEGRVVAFANIWLSAGKSEASVDLMRHRHDAPKGHMDFLFVQLMLWAKAQGFARFNLGMAPLSGLEVHPLASTWHKAGNLIFEHGGQIYGFEGLRAFKEKFRPEWQPRYLACQGGLALPRALFDVAVLVSRQKRSPVPQSRAVASATARFDIPKGVRHG